MDSHPIRTDGDPEPTSPVVTHIAPQLAAILSLAHEEARAINDTGVGSDHLMLALLRPECGGIAREVLDSLGVDLEGARSLLLESYGDPLEPHARELQVAPAVRYALAEANRIASELQDEEAASEHLLVVLIERCSADLPSALAEALQNEGWEIRVRVLAVTEATYPSRKWRG
jgi:ATP-dependent Clp protease ATP-binding subunit ClpA